MITKERLELAHWAAEAARVAGADEAAVNIQYSRAVEVEFRDGQLDRVKESTQNSLTLTVYADHRFGATTTNDLRRDSLGKLIRDSVDRVSYLGQDEFRQLPDPRHYEGIVQTELDLIDSGYDEVSSDERVKIAGDLQKLTASKSDKIVSSTGGYYDDSSESIKVHSNGFEGIRQTTSFQIGAEATIDDGQGGRPNDYDYCNCRYLSDVPDPEATAQAAVTRALAKVGQAKAESGVYDMILVNRAAGQPLFALYSPLSARSLQQKRSFLDGMLGKKIGSDRFTFIDDPFIKRGLGSRLYDGEGMAARKRTIVEKGILKEYLIDCYYGRKLGMEPTGGSTSNVLFEYGDQSVDDMIKTVEKGILVNGFIGGNSNGTTGDYSWGLQGMLIENGKIVRPVYQMNIDGNLIDLWNSLVAMGNDPYPYSSVKRPSMHFKDIQFAGI